MGRTAGAPGKYNPLFCLSGISHEGLQGRSIVYGIGDRETGEIVYVGQTINPVGRFQSYRKNSSCHNEHLSRWLKKHKGKEFIAVLYEGSDLDKMEKYWISHFGRANLVNQADGGTDFSRKGLSWNSPNGDRCPSDLFVWKINNRRNSGTETARTTLKRMIEARRKLTIVERALFEVGVARDILEEKISPIDELLRNRVDRWLVAMEERLNIIFNKGFANG